MTTKAGLQFEKKRAKYDKEISQINNSQIRKTLTKLLANKYFPSFKTKTKLTCSKQLAHDQDLYHGSKPKKNTNNQTKQTYFRRKQLEDHYMMTCFKTTTEH
ncbi:hypothetical protein A4A49_26458 [Nicotiana attenuata]|uniref:Uncharacterized protein n=1 Tax=Nicotiana attenuata TaxID=49451 RepID=A0A1J6KYL8_NICAT|nr:hypothetical protein A4A49_26458 [Nicotiana attenuata]